MRYATRMQRMSFTRTSSSEALSLYFEEEVPEPVHIENIMLGERRF